MKTTILALSCIILLQLYEMIQLEDALKEAERKLQEECVPPIPPPPKGIFLPFPFSKAG